MRIVAFEGDVGLVEGEEVVTEGAVLLKGELLRSELE